mmetsp:Transcript_77747/g.251576  ORF Transcript_77747/g.251576 Transcript_77747/m.251576 type:complete len:336 (+) Transcript_77747:551-1558(+)
MRMASSRTLAWSVFVPIAFGRVAKRGRCLFGALWAITSLIILHSIAMQQYRSLQSMVTNSYLRGSLLPLMAWVYRVASEFVLKHVLPRFLQVGVPESIPAVAPLMLLGLSEAARLVALLSPGSQESGLDALFFFVGSVVASFCTDLSSRMLLTTRLMNSARKCCGGTKSNIKPETDLILRCRFAVSYLAIPPALAVSASAYVAGAPWARRWTYWLGFVVYMALGLLVDGVIVAVHHFIYIRPGEGEGWMDTWRRVRSPDGHWPELRDAGRVVAGTPELFEEGPGGLCVCACMSDAHIAVLMIMVVVGSGVVSTMAATFGPCYIWDHPDNCAVIAP